MSAQRAYLDKTKEKDSRDVRQKDSCGQKRRDPLEKCPHEAI